MTALQHQYLALVERDRRLIENQHEPAGRRISRIVRLFAFSAVRVGVDVAQTAGDKLKELLPPSLLSAMYAAYRGGLRRAGLESRRRLGADRFTDAGSATRLGLPAMMGVPVPAAAAIGRFVPPSFEVYEHGHAAEATNDAVRFAGGVAERIRKELRFAQQSYAGELRVPLPAYLAAVRTALDSAGVSADPARDHGVSGVLTTAILRHYGLGTISGFNSLDADGPKGYRHVSIVDERTTDICREMHMTQLPADHPFWQTHWAPLHWGCRSVDLPIWNQFEETDPLPSVDAAAGFGRPY